MIGKLHDRLLERPIVQTGCTAEVILQRVTDCCSSLQVSAVIANSITEYERSRRTKIVAFRASEVHHLANDEDSWTVVEWVEEDHLKCLVIFHFENASEPGSWLMRSGYNERDNDRSMGMWQEPRVDYNVAAISHLKTLFGVAQHFLGVLEWATADATILYGEQDFSDVSTQEE